MPAISQTTSRHCLSLATFFTAIVLHLVFALAPLYITDPVAKGGLGFSITEGFSIYGTWYGLSFVTPLIGGVLPSFGITERAGLTLGYCLSAVGIALFCTHSVALLQYAFFFLAVGNGIARTMQTALLHVVVSPMKTDKKKAYRTFHLATCLGFAGAAFFGGYLYSQYSFLTLLYFLFLVLGAAMLLVKYHPVRGTTYVEQEPSRGHASSLIYLLIAGIPFFLGYAQLNTSLLYCAHNNIPRMIGAFEIPAIWLGAISTMCVLLWVSFVPQKNRINDFRSIALATCMNAIGFASVAYIPISHGLISFFLGYLLIGTADLMIRPRLMHIISESVPAHKRSLITGCVFAAIGLSVKLGSQMAGYVSTLGIPTFFSLFTLFYLAWGGVILVLERKHADSLRALSKHPETS